MADQLNQNENRIRRAIQNDPSLGDRGETDLYSFSLSKNRRVERTCSDVDYDTHLRTVTSADSDPNSVAPGAISIWDLKGYWGLHGYLVFTGGTSPTASVSLWCLDTTNNRYFLVDSVHGVGEKEEFRFDGKVRNRVCFLQVTNLPVGVTSIDLVASVE